MAAPRTGTFSGCGDASHAAQTYRSTLAESEIRAFYRDELTRDGWRTGADQPRVRMPATATRQALPTASRTVR
ncbi:hypothetical protein Alo02nite_85480 [Actinoplanes lobatus]|uniref:Uncharacterized protein n=1 Tax=Actinoplanes lobatus TaxID=113568 RepID=A0ABQ4AXY1_9ACTN|nr:hypothetical protein Alo02nite_85480 [Actinoplanes lobatus]